MLSLTGQPKWVSIAVLTAVVFLGAAIRLHDLGKRTMTHIEIWVPGIDLPADLSIPSPRLDLRQTLSGMLVEWEPHPPAYYVLMLGWTRSLGTSMWALRLPSVLFGIASIVLVYCVGVLEKDRPAALFASAMLALNGHHVFWSQLARFYPMACCLGLLSTALLLLAYRAGARQRLAPPLYWVVTLLGLATTHFFWPVFATHVLWLLVRTRDHETVPGQLRWQLALLTAGIPLIALAIFQSGTRSYLARDILSGLSHFLQFGFLFEPDGRSGPPGLAQVASGILLLLLALSLLAWGLASHGRDPKQAPTDKGPPSVFLVLIGLAASLIILRLGMFTSALAPRRSKVILVGSVVPLLLPIVDLQLQRHWRSLQRAISVVHERCSLSRIPKALSAFLAIVPTAMLAVLSLFFPMFLSRGVLLYTPYLMLVLSKGLLALVRRTRLWIVVAAILAVIHPLSIVHYRHSNHEHPTDYKSLAERWMPMIEDNDLIFVQRHWATTPMFYYLARDRYFLVGANYAEEINRHPDSRVWVLSLEGIPMSSQMEKALEEYAQEKKLEALGIWTELYDRKVTDAWQGVTQTRVPVYACRT